MPVVREPKTHPDGTPFYLEFPDGSRVCRVYRGPIAVVDEETGEDTFPPIDWDRICEVFYMLEDAVESRSHERWPTTFIQPGAKALQQRTNDD